jgi:hypothetical protein
MAKTAAVSVRLPEDVKAALERAAEKDQRSVASYVEILLTKHLQAEGHLRPAKKTT